MRVPSLVALALIVLPGFRLLRGGRGVLGPGREIQQYRRDVAERTGRIDKVLGELSEAVDQLRRREMEPDEVLEKLTVGEAELDAAAEQMRDMLAPEELHGLHMEFEANLERALRGIVTVERGCMLTRLRHRRLDEEEVQNTYKRGHLNMLHARMRMGEVAEGLLAWEPGKPASADVSSRLRREPE